MSLSPYDLPGNVRNELIALAATSDFLIIGEIHGTQEVPRLILDLLPYLSDLGYASLALEIDHAQREQLVRCANCTDEPPLLFKATQFRDGRGSEQALSMLEQVVAADWNLLCFDVSWTNEGDAWSVRDRGMAENLLQQWDQYCPSQKLLGVCGNMHSRLTPMDAYPEYWPSFARSVQQLRPEISVNSISVTYGRGAFYNGSIQTFDLPPGERKSEPEVRVSPLCGHTLELYLPTATPVTFLD